jgi:hypothetical protein
MEEHGVPLIKQCKLLALKGDPTALRLCIERLLPPSKPLNNRFRMPPVRTREDMAEVVPALMGEVAPGRLSIEDAEALARILETHQQAMSAAEFDARLKALEERILALKKSGKPVQ